MTSRERGFGVMTPDRLMIEVPGVDKETTRFLSGIALELAQRSAPKLTGASYRNLIPLFGDGWFGIKWQDNHVWFQENGINPFTMRSLAGKTIPMWINDPTGEEGRKNPNAERRVTADGRRQILIFRKAAPIGSRKTVIRDGVSVDVPRSYPGAPGRINRREPIGSTRGGMGIGGRIARGNVGVRWRHPGLHRRSFIRRSLIMTCQYAGLPPGPIRDDRGRFR